MTVRTDNLAVLSEAGFHVAASLPVVRSTSAPILRPLDEIAGRLCALSALFTWVAIPEERLASAEFEMTPEQRRLIQYLTEDEADIRRTLRFHAHWDHRETIGWRLENMWALAWVLGFEPAPSLAGQIDDATQHSLLHEFLHSPADTPESLLPRVTPRSVAVVDAMEDLFYCAHNAVRSAQLGGSTVPAGFHPVADGGAVHERRQALTWALSPGIAWDDTDVST